MPPTLDDFVKRAEEFVTMAKAVLASADQDGYVDSTSFHELRSSSLSFIASTYGTQHNYYRDFEKRVVDIGDHNVKHAIGILTAIHRELAGGWVRTTRGLVSAEVFADFLEMAEHLLEEGYKDAAAAMVGGVLEGHLRQLASKSGVPTAVQKDGKMVPRKTDALNADLVKASAYGKLEMKSVTAWLDLRNEGAHGHYDKYGANQVANMLTGVRDFIVRHQI